MGQTDLFWKAHSKRKPGRDNFFPTEFKNLIEKMFQLNPNDRLSMSEILGHKWMQGETASQTQIRIEFRTRNMKNKLEKEKDQKER